ARRILPEDPDRAGVGAPIAFDDLDGRGLAGSVRAEHRDDLARRDVHRHVLDDGPPSVSLGQPIYEDGRPGHGAIRAYCVSKSVSRTSPIWIERTTPAASMKK